MGNAGTPLAAGEASRRLRDLHNLLMLSLINLMDWEERHFLGLVAAAVRSVTGARWVVLALTSSEGTWVARRFTMAGEQNWPDWAAEALGTAWVRVVHRLDLPSNTAELLKGDPSLARVAKEMELDHGRFVPVRTGRGELGVLAVGLPSDIPLDDHLRFALDFTASQAAAGIESARLRSRLSETVTALERWKEVHNQLTCTVAAGEGLAAVAGVVANLLGNPVAVLDPALLTRVTAPGSLPAEVFEACVRRARGGPDVRSTTVVGADGAPVEALVAPVTAGDAVLGYLCVLGRERPLAPADILAVEHAATVVALELQKEETARQVEQRLRGNLLSMVLHGDFLDREALLERAARLGCDLGKPHRVLVLQRRGGTARGETGRVARLVEQVAPTLAHGALVGIKGERVVCLVPLFGAREDDPSRRVADRVVAVAAGLQPPLAVVAGIGRVCRDLGHYPESFHQARHCLEVLERTGSPAGVVAHEELGLYRLADGLSETQLRSFIASQLEPLWAYDRQNGTPLGSTLLAYLESGCNLQKTAQRLFVHIGTVKYRLRRVEEVSGVDIGDPAQRLNLHVALKLALLVTGNGDHEASSSAGMPGMGDPPEPDMPY